MFDHWDILCSSCVSEDLGIYRLRKFNIFLLYKWWRKFLTNHHPPWVQVVNFNYCWHRRPLDLHDKLPGHVSPFWHGVLWTSQAFKLGLRLKCAQGCSVKFWKHYWIGEIPLAVVFPSFFEMAPEKEAWANSLIQEKDWALTLVILSPWWDFDS